MQIKKRVRINVAVSVMTAFVICLVLFLSLYRLNKANNLGRIAGDIIAGTLERVTFRNDYLRNNSARAKVQWFARQEQIGGLLKTALGNFRDSDDRKNITGLIEDHEASGKIFAAIVANREKNGLNSGSVALAREVEDRLLSQLNMRVYEESIHSRKMLESARKARNSALRAAGLGVFSALIVLIAMAMINSWTLGLAITARVARLREGVAVIGDGDLEHWIDIKGDDEFAELAESFNAMTAKLRGSYRELEKEVDERRRAEKKLQETANELQTANTDLDDSRRAAINLMDDALAARRQAEETAAALRDSEERLRLLGDNLPDSAVYQYVHEPDGKVRFLHFSAGVERLNGVTVQEVLANAQVLHRQIAPEYLERLVEAEARSARELSDFDMEVPMRHPDGEVRWMRLRSRPRRWSDGRVIWDGVQTDVTEHKRAEEALRAKEADLSEAQRLAHIGSWYWDAMTDVTTGSDELLRIYGFDPATQSMPDFKEQRGLCYPVEAWERVNAAVQRSLETGIGYALDVRAIHNGTTIWVTTRGEVLRDDKDRFVGLRGTVQDITERKRAEQALEMAHDEMSKLVEEQTRELKEKEVLLKEIHHRVKNNLQVISSLVSLQADGSKDETVREVLRDVTDRVRSMALVHEKLYQSADLAHVDFAEYSRSLLGYLWRAHGTPAASIRLNLNLEQVTLPVDTAVPCGLILNELAGNALKHAFRGRDKGEVTVSMQRGANDRIRLIVADNGVGLPEGLDWRQANSLGLRLVQMLSGQLGAAVETRGRAGTQFEITFGNAVST